MAWSIEFTGTIAACTAAINAIQPGTDVNEATYLTIAKTAMLSKLALVPTPFARVYATGHVTNDGSVTRVVLDAVLTMTTFGQPLDGSYRFPQ